MPAEEPWRGLGERLRNEFEGEDVGLGLFELRPDDLRGEPRADDLVVDGQVVDSPATDGPTAAWQAAATDPLATQDGDASGEAASGEEGQPAGAEEFGRRRRLAVLGSLAALLLIAVGLAGLAALRAPDDWGATWVGRDRAPAGAGASSAPPALAREGRPGSPSSASGSASVSGGPSASGSGGPDPGDDPVTTPPASGPDPTWTTRSPSPSPSPTSKSPGRPTPTGPD